MKGAGSFLVLVLLIAAVIVLSNAVYVVDETEQVVITQFGRPLGAPIVTPGLKLKVPFMHKANFFEKRFLDLDGEPNQVPTKDKRFIWVDTYARWRISDPLLYFQRLRDERRAQSRLADILNGETRNAVANHELVELVRTTNRASTEDPEAGTGDEEQGEILQDIKYGRDKIRREVLTAAAERTQDLGIELLDVRFKRINYVTEVRDKVYERMITERKRIAERYRSEGLGESARIRGKKERDLKQIESEAYRESQGIIGLADAEATRIYAEAYNRDPDFYRFLKTMESYRASVGEDTLLVLSDQSEYFRFFKDSKPR